MFVLQREALNVHGVNSLNSISIRESTKTALLSERECNSAQIQLGFISSFLLLASTSLPTQNNTSKCMYLEKVSKQRSRFLKDQSHALNLTATFKSIQKLLRETWKCLVKLFFQSLYCSSIKRDTRLGKFKIKYKQACYTHTSQSFIAELVTPTARLTAPL